MEFKKQAELKVMCIASEEDFAFFGITFDDLLERTESGFRFIRKAKELAGANQGVEWTDTAYTLQIATMPDRRISLTFSETIADYIENLKHSMGLADEETMEPLKEFIDTLEHTDEINARKLVSRFEKNIRKAQE